MWSSFHKHRNAVAGRYTEHPRAYFVFRSEAASREENSNKISSELKSSEAAHVCSHGANGDMP